MLKLFVSFVVTAQLLLIADGNFTEDLYIKMWRGTDGFVTADDFPETPLLALKPSIALGLSGGGVMSATSSFGLVSVLNEHDLIKKIRYLGSVSGGSWFSSGFTYGQNIVNDTEYLGPILQPEFITPTSIYDMDPKCGRQMAANKFYVDGLGYFFSLTGGSAPAASAYCLTHSCSAQARQAFDWTVWSGWLEFVGITQGNDTFLYNEAAKTEFLERNPNVDPNSIILPANPDRPFLVMSGTIIGPAQTTGGIVSSGIYDEGNQNFSNIEFTSMYTGQAKNLEVVHSWETTIKKVVTVNEIVQQTGGFIELPGAFGTAPLQGLAPGQSSGMASVSKPTLPVGLVSAAAISSYAPESVFAAGTGVKVAMQYETWSPVSPSATTPLPDLTTWIGDGGVFQNQPLINFLQRRVKHIFLTFTDSVPLAPADIWDVNADPSNLKYISIEFPSYFGWLPPDSNPGMKDCWEYRKNQVFAQAEYFSFVEEMQASLATGNGIVVTANLTTVENAWWGIPAGLQITLTALYVSRALNWEAKLPAAMQALVVPEVNASNPLSLRQTGDYAGFPCWNAFQGGGMTANQANLQANLVGWIAQQHIEKLLAWAAANNENTKPVIPADSDSDSNSSKPNIQEQRAIGIAVGCFLFLLIVLVAGYFWITGSSKSNVPAASDYSLAEV